MKREFHPDRFPLRADDLYLRGLTSEQIVAHPTLQFLLHVFNAAVEEFEQVITVQYLDSGWFVANDDTILTCGIERCDDVGRFESDVEARLHVMEVALRDKIFKSERGRANVRGAVLANMIHSLADEARCLVWGPEHVGSRTPPQ